MIAPKRKAEIHVNLDPPQPDSPFEDVYRASYEPVSPTLQEVLRAQVEELADRRHNPDRRKQIIERMQARRKAYREAYRQEHGTEPPDVSDIGWDRPRRCFVDHTGFPIHRCFKLYPWEWMVNEEFGPNIRTGSTRFTPGREASCAAASSGISTNMAFATVSTAPMICALRCSKRGRNAFCSERRRVR